MLIGFFFKVNFGFGQIQKQIISIKEDIYSIQEVFKIVKNELDIDIGFVLQDVNLEKKVLIPGGNYQLKHLMEKILPSADFRILYKPGKILIKKERSSESNLIKSEYGDNIFGYVIDSETGERMVGATLYNEISQVGTTTNMYGYFSIPGDKESVLQIRFLGYQSKIVKMSDITSMPFYIALTPDEKLLNNVEISENALGDQLMSIENGLKKISVSSLKSIPVLGGEPDILKTIQLMPGVATVGEGTSAYFVRGGNQDQNLILLDEAPVYNPAHALGFFSVFNSDAVKDLNFYNIHMPVRYGSKLSSVLDVRMKDGNLNKHSISGGIGIIASRIMLEGPISKGKSSYMISGRRTYADFLWKTLSSDEATKKTSIFFYDLNTKLNFKLGKKDHLYVSGFFGRDINEIDIQQYGVIWDNSTLTMKWNHLFSDNLFANTSLIYSNYSYDIGLSGENNLYWNSTIEDFTAKLHMEWFPGRRKSFNFGASSTFHVIKPGMTTDPAFSYLNLSNANALENVLYIENEFKLTPKLNFSTGLRATLFQNIGPSTLYRFDESYQVADSSIYPPGKIYNTFVSIDPRLSANWQINNNSSLKASYNKTSQFIHFVQNNMIPFSAFDQWVISNPNIEPQYAHHFNLGYHYLWQEKGLELSTDIFYKKMTNQLDAADHAHLLLNRYVEGEIRTGEGKAYGFEITLEKPQGIWQGYLSYTFARARRKISGINQGDWYNAPFDRPHSFQTSQVYNPNQRITYGVNWTYSTGSPVTLPAETFNYDDLKVPVYTGRNQYRMPDFHRLDLSVTINRKQNKNVANQSSWVFALYNVYSRKNASSVFSSPLLDSEGIDIIDPSTQQIYKSWLFSIVPSITYNFKF